MDKLENSSSITPEPPPVITAQQTTEDGGKFLTLIRVLVAGALAIFTVCLCLVALLVEPVAPMFLATVGIAWAMAWVCRLILKRA
jgi:hypothetical protein